MVASKPPGSGGVVSSLKGPLCDPRVKWLAIAAAGGVLAYLAYSYATASGCATASCEAKSNSGQKPTKKGSRTRGKRKRRSASSAKLGKASTSSTSTPGKPEELVESPAVTPSKPEDSPAVPPVPPTPASVASSTSTAPVDQTEPTQ